jgi:hypothetical protein
VTLVDETESAAGLRYLGDEYRARQILVNLLSNAVKFTPAGGRVRLECRAQPARDGRDGPGDLLFVVSDSGEGVKPGDVERIFEPFVQGTAGLTRRHGGTGLGLPISRRLARLMGGEVWVDPEAPGPGATFVLRLPAGSPAPAGSAAEGGAAQAEPGGPARRAAAGRELAAAGEALLRQISPAVDEFVRRARAEPTLGFTEEMSNLDVADHLGTLLIDVANSLAILAGAQGEPSELLADGSRIQRVIGELHGAQRQRLGWGEPQLLREVELVREVCLATMARSLGDDERARGAAVFALERLLDERTRACLNGLRAAAAAA